jgi:hypothetical protein
MLSVGSMMLLFVWNYYFLFDVIVLLSLLNILCSSYPCSTLLLLLSLLDISIPHILARCYCPSLLVQCCCSFTLFLTLLLFLCLLNIVVPPLFAQRYSCCVLAQCYSSFLLAWHYSFAPCLTLLSLLLAPPFSLVDIVAFVLFVRFYYSYVLAWHCCSSLLARHCNSCTPCSMLPFLHSLLVFNIVCSHSCTFLVHHDVAALLLLFPCSMLLLLYSLLNVVVPILLILDSYFPLVFLQMWVELSKFNFFRANLEGEVFFFNLCLLMIFFYYPCFWEILINNVYVCCVQELFGHCTFSFTHCVFFNFSFNCLQMFRLIFK